jgi:MFS family permease
MPSRVGKLSDKIGRVIPICGGLIMVGFATMLITVVHNYYWLILAWTIETAGISLLSPAQAVLLSDKTNCSASIGSTYGLYTFTRSLGLIIGPIFGSWLYSCYGITAFQISGSIILGSAVFAFWGLRGKKIYAAVKPRCQKAQ